MNTQFTAEGYLLNLADWNQEIAAFIVKQSQIELTAEHWLIINYLRDFYQQFPTIKFPSMRVLIKELNKLLAPEKANTLYFQRLFPGGLVQAAKIAGLPKSSRCQNTKFL